MNPSWQVWVAIAIGGAAGAALRHGAASTRWGALRGVFVTNTLAAGILGVLLSQSSSLSPFWFALLATGLCGALSTYSTFAVQVWELMQDRVLSGIGYVVATTAAGCVAALVPLLLWGH